MTAATVPTSYLGLGARLRDGPSELLVRTGFRTETSCGPRLHRWFGLVDITHALALLDADLVDDTSAAELLETLLDMQALDPAQFPWDPVHGDPYNSREHFLGARLGDVAGHLHLGRTRREAGRCAFWLATQDALLGLHRECESLAGVLARRSSRLATAWWADMTYVQPAQVSSFGHYLLSIAHEVERQVSRVRRGHGSALQLPVLSGGVAGTSVPLRRESYVDRLGVSAEVTTTRDAMWATDNVVDVMVTACQAALTTSRLAEDMLMFCSPAFGYLRLHDAHSRASVHLPQKRNPYALTVLRGGANSIIGRTSGILATVRTPTAQSDNWTHTYGDVLGTIDDVTDLVALCAEVVEHLQVDTDRLAERAHAGFTDATELAEQLAVNGTDYRSAHRAVGHIAAIAEAEGRDRFSGADRLALRLADVNPDNAASVAARDVPGGAAPGAVRASARRLARRLSTQRRWRESEESRSRNVTAGLLTEAAAVVRSVTDQPTRGGRRSGAV